MERRAASVFANLNLKVVDGDTNSIELIDELDFDTGHPIEDIANKYFKDLYDELSQRGDSSSPGLAKTILLEYLNLPGLVGNRVYNLYDPTNKGYTNKKDFLTKCQRLLSPGLEDKMKLVFDLLDFSSDGYVEKADIGTLLSHVPLQKMNGRVSLKALTKYNLDEIDVSDRARSLKEIQAVVECVMQGKSRLGFDDFKEITEVVCSDIFLCIYFLLRRQIPFYNQLCILVGKLKKLPAGEKKLTSPQRISSPKVLNQFSSVGRVIRRNSYVESVFASTLNKNNKSDKENEKPGPTQPAPSSERRVKKHLTFTTCSLFQAAHTLSDSKPVPTRKKSVAWEDIASASPGIEEEAKDLQPVVVYCSCGRICKKGLGLCDECSLIEQAQEVSGYLYVEKDERNVDRYWFSLVNTDLYCYKDKCDKDYLQMINIGGYFVEEKGVYKIDEQYTLYEFVLCTQWEKRTLYAISAAERKMWVTALRQALGLFDIYKHYEMGGIIGKGAFGEVRIGRHKEKGAKVAIKVLAKRKMKMKDYDLFRNEIEALKLCQHPNIVRLYDVVETLDNIFIVMELLNAGTLKSYLKEHGPLPESQAKDIVVGIVRALEYLKKFGIVHRDLKPSNILMTEDGIPKLADFGLAILLGPSQKRKEFAGTLDYTCPEMIIGIPYGQEADMWSLGVITYTILCEGLPFKHQEYERLKLYFCKRQLYRNILKEEVRFHKAVSTEAKSFIKGLLMKNPKSRLTIKQVLQHPWLRECL